MGESGYIYTVFTKPWQEMPLDELGQFVSEMGFDGVELPVRPGFQVEPEKVQEGLPRAKEILNKYGVEIASVAGPTDEKTIKACGEVGVPVIRICVRIGDDGYLATEARMQKEFSSLVPLLDEYGVTLGIQNHCGHDVCNAMGVRHLIEDFDPGHVGAVYDPAHNALDGEEPALAVDILWSHLCMVNLKSAFWRRKSGPEAEDVEWEYYWTTGRQGLVSWPEVAVELKKRNYKGVLCLTAEYSDRQAVDRLIAEDLEYAKALFEND